MADGAMQKVFGGPRRWFSIYWASPHVGFTFPGVYLVLGRRQFRAIPVRRVNR